MNTGPHNPAMLAALQRQQQHHQQQQQAHGQMNTAMMNGMGNMTPTQQQQFQQMLAARYQGAGMNMGGGGNFNPQMMQSQQQQQHQGTSVGGSMGMNPQALLNMGAMGMNGRTSIGSGDGFNSQMFQQQQQFSRSANGGGVNPQMLSNMNATQIANGGMNGMSNNMMGVGGGMGGMNMGMGGGMSNGGMGSMGINPQALNMGAPGAQNPSASSPTPPSQSINLAALNASSGMGMAGGLGNNMNGLPVSNQQLSQMNQQDRQRMMKMMYLQQQQQMRARAANAGAGMGGGDDGSMGMHGRDGMQGLNTMGAMGAGMGGMGMRGGDQSMGMDGMMSGMPSNFNVGLAGNAGGMAGMNNGMMNMGGMAGMGMGMGNAGGIPSLNPTQLAQMQQLQAQHAQGQGQDRPASSMSMAQASQGQGHMQQQQQHHQNANMGMMPPPSSIPPRPPTAASQSPAPRPGTAGGAHGMMGPPSFNAHMPIGMQQQQGPQYQLARTNSPRPGTAGGTPGASSPGANGMPMSRAGSSLGMHHPQQNVQQQQQPGAPDQTGQNQQQQNHASPIPIQPRPQQAGAHRGASPAPIPRPGTSQSMHGLRAITPALVGSRPGTATGFRPQQQHPSTPGAQQGAEQSQQHQQNQQTHTPLATPTSATYPPIAPAPTHAGTPGPGSPMSGVKRRISGTPVSGMSSSTPNQGQQDQQGAAAQAQMAHQQGMPGQMPMNAGSTPQLSNMRMQGGMPGAGVNMAGANGLMNASGMGPPGISRAQSNHLPGGDMGVQGMNGMPNPAMSRQGSLGPNIPGITNAAGLSINTNLNPNLNPAMAMAAAAAIGPMNAMGTPTASASPNPAMLVDGGLPVAPSTPNRQASLPPTTGSPFTAGGMMGMPGTERKISGQGLLSGVAPLTRSSSDLFSTATSAVTASSAAATSTVPAVAGAPPIPPVTATQIVPQLPPLPTNVKLNSHVTRVTVVPLIDSETTIPALKQEEIEKVQGWMKIDKEYEALHQKMRDRMTEEVKDVVAKHRAWWERNPQDDPRVKRPKVKLDLIGIKGASERSRNKKLGKREGFKLPRTVDMEDASRPEQLVPIRLEFDVEHHKMRDTFVWNLNDPIITPEIFAQSIVDDYSLTQNYHSVITKAIQEQLSDFKAHSTTFGEDGVMNETEDVILKGEIEADDATWWEAWRDRVRSDAYTKPADAGEARSRKRRKIVKDEPDELKQVPAAHALDHAMSVDEFEEDENKMLEEMRILVKLDIIVGPVKLEDQFEWDLDSPDPSPEFFADVYARELGLGGEFRTAIAHSIREQVQIYQKSLFLVGHPSDGSAIQDDDLRLSLLPSLNTGARSMDQVMAFTPQLNYLSDSELERNEKEREKELNRRRRKTTRGRRGIPMPDREPPKTFRTPAIGFPEVDAQTLALANAAAAPTSRRAAAAAASLTIANMVASENGTSLSPQQTMHAPPAQAAAPPPPKEKKPKGLMKPPSYPASVLRPRANVKAPTPSTAAEASTVPPPIDDDPPIETNAPENRGARVPISTKKAKELEREAKEREYIDGQHANYIDGIWHCSNCGCPESIAVGRRKGPLGDKSQCGVCGKFWHRHRRPRPVEYNSSLEYHMGLKRAEEEARIAASRRKRPHAHHPEASSSKAPTIEPETPRKQPSPEPRPDEPISTVRLDPPVSPMSSTSSISEPPSAQALKANGAEHSSASVAAPSEATDDAEAKRDTPNPRDGTPATPASALSAKPRRPLPPWLKTAMEELQEKYPDDKFDAIIRKAKEPGQNEWRIRCSDCPGKLYTAGPGESLTNYEVHLKNRQHRQKVNLRVGGQS